MHTSSPSFLISFTTLAFLSCSASFSPAYGMEMKMEQTRSATDLHNKITHQLLDTHGIKPEHFGIDSSVTGPKVKTLKECVPFDAEARAKKMHEDYLIEREEREEKQASLPSSELNSKLPQEPLKKTQESSAPSLELDPKIPRIS